METEENVIEEEEQAQEVETTEGVEGTEDKPLEPWMIEEEAAEDQTPVDPSNNVPVGKHVAVKRKLRGQIADLEDETEKLRAENEALRSLNPKVQESTLSRPSKDDFDTDEDYNAALDDYYDKRAQQTYERNSIKASKDVEIKKAQEAVLGEVDRHYERADKLIEESGIKPEIYKDADKSVRVAVNNIIPNGGDAVTDHIISLLGEGSEKVMYYLGRNKAALNKFQALLAEDPNGMKAAIYLGQEKQRLTNPIKSRTQAPDPAPQANGDANVGLSAKALKRKYDKIGPGTTESYKIKQTAKKNGVDVSTW